MRGMLVREWGMCRVCWGMYELCTRYVWGLLKKQGAQERG